MARAALTEEEFSAHAIRIIDTATADEIIAEDVIAAMAKALGTILAATAQSTGVPVDELMDATWDDIAIYARVSADLSRAAE